ncbi:conserved hypothetical protein [Frankia canadensis]|uniref:Uncharacterized protein n=1 Tax=Frankia canadensis TaxID=1836972 RepID=A0A2I2KPZ1_9ACTN|nr:hypothetical protein [Frankia canadensis]SNQ47738.1 conserved hypothetical protein [Frankia canadensis]SOU55028.1 conserved hypothetical protein [Frankia canadensis]
MTDTNTYVYVDADTREVRIVRGEADKVGAIVGRLDPIYPTPDSFAADEAAGFAALGEAADKLLSTLEVRHVSDWSPVGQGLYAVVEETVPVPTAG